MEDTSIVKKRVAQDKEMLIEQLRKNPVLEMACSKAEVGRSSYYRWRKEDEQFAKDADEAIRDGSLLMNDVAEGYLLAAIRDKNMSAISLWLKAHHPSYATKIQLSGSVEVREKFTPAEQSVVEEALQLSAIIKKDGIKKIKQ